MFTFTDYYIDCNVSIYLKKSLVMLQLTVLCHVKCACYLLLKCNVSILQGVINKKLHKIVKKQSHF